MDGRKKTVPAISGAGIMIREIYQNYHLPMNPMSLTLRELRFWYEPLIPSLIEMQKTAKKNSQRI